MRFEPIAIVGRACVLPGALSPAELWDAVLRGADAAGACLAGHASAASVLANPGAHATQ